MQKKAVHFASAIMSWDAESIFHRPNELWGKLIMKWEHSEQTILNINNIQSFNKVSLSKILLIGLSRQFCNTKVPSIWVNVTVIWILKIYWCKPKPNVYILMMKLPLILLEFAFENTTSEFRENLS